MVYRHRVRVRYADIDRQAVVYNANYLAFIDDALDTWLRSYDRQFESRGWDIMLKSAVITWHEPARLADLVDIDVAVARYGTSSFDVHFAGSVDGTACFDASLTYVAVDGEAQRPCPIPAELRAHLGEPE